MCKIWAFEYLVYLCIDWYENVSGRNDWETHFSTLSLLKLLFFASSIRNDERFENPDLLDIFDNFYALPHGPVESDIYNGINSTIPFFKSMGFEGGLNRFLITSQKVELLQTPASVDDIISELSDDTAARLKDSIKVLRSINENLITYSAFELVEISHKWSCWKDAYAVATSLGVKAQSMPVESIKRSDRHFSV